MRERLTELQEQLKRLSEQAREYGEVRRDLTGAARTLEERVAENLKHTQRLLQESLPADPVAESAIGEGLRTARERLDSAAAGVTGGEQERIGRAREQLRDVLRNLAGMSPEQAGGFGGGRDDTRGRLPGDSVNLREALRANAGVLRNLRGGLVSRPKAVGEIDDVIAGLTELAENLDDEQTLRRHAQLLQALQAVDYSLRDEAGAPSRAPTGFAPRHVQPDTEHRPIVEAYFRELSESVPESD